MPKKTSALRDAGLSVALARQERETMDKAAKLQDLQTSVWARATLLREARRIIAEAKVAK